MNKYKKDFPIFKNIPKLVYLDSAATSQKPQVVIDAVEDFYTSYNSNIHRGLYPIAEKATEKVEEVRRKVAKFINAKSPSEIIFTHGTTEGINILASDSERGLDECSEVIISEMEHHSNFVPWQNISEKKKARLLFFTIDKNGNLTNRVIDQKGKAVYTGSFLNDSYNCSVVSLAHVSNVLGTINPVKQILKKMIDEITVSFDNFIIDAAQSVPHMPVDVQDIDCSFMVFSGHKMLAPTGVGVLYGKKELLENVDPFLYGSQMIQEVALEKTTYTKVPEKFEPGTLPIESIIGLGAAIDYLEGIGMETIREHEKDLTHFTLEQLDKIEGLRIYGPKVAERRSGVIAFTIDGIHPHDVAQVLADENICVRAGHHCALPLHKRLGVPATIRISFHIYNDEEDIDKLIKGLKKVKKIFSLR